MLVYKAIFSCYFFNQIRQGMVDIGITNEFKNEIFDYNQYTNKCKINATIKGSRYSKE